MATNTTISRRKAAVSDPDTIYFLQEGKENDYTQFLKAQQKEFVELLSMESFEVIPRIIVPEVNTPPPEVWAMKRKYGYKQYIYTSIRFESI